MLKNISFLVILFWFGVYQVMGGVNLFRRSHWETSPKQQLFFFTKYKICPGAADEQQGAPSREMFWEPGRLNLCLQCDEVLGAGRKP